MQAWWLGGQLEPLEIAWPHDNNEDVIKANWNRRKERLNNSKLIFITDDEGLTNESIEMWDEIAAYKKIILVGKNSKITSPSTEVLDVDDAHGLQYKKLNGLFRFQGVWDFVDFFNKR